MMPERFDTIDTITPTVMRVGRNPVVGDGEHHPKRCAIGRSQPEQNALTNAQRLVGQTIGLHRSARCALQVRSLHPLDQATQPQSP
jgi:hypothetical protein